MKSKIILSLILLTNISLMGQSISLGKPITTPSITGYTPKSLLLELSPQPKIEVKIISVTGREEVFNYPCQPFTLPEVNPCTTDTLAEVTSLINALNTANLSTRNLWRRVFDRLVLDFPSRFPDGATVQ